MHRTIDALPRPETPLRSGDDSYLSWFILRSHAELAGDGGNLALTGAIEHAVAAHRDQWRTDHRGVRQPYILHPLRNTARLLMFGVSNLDILIASLFHDTVEDVPDALVAALTGEYELAPLDALRTTYGDAVADTVYAVTNPGEHALLPRVERNAAYVAHVAEEVSKDAAVALVKTADFLDNAGGLLLLHRARPDMAKRLAAKYLPLVNILSIALTQPGITDYTDYGQDLRDDVHATGKALEHILAA